MRVEKHKENQIHSTEIKKKKKKRKKKKKYQVLASCFKLAIADRCKLRSNQPNFNVEELIAY